MMMKDLKKKHLIDTFAVNAEKRYAFLLLYILWSTIHCASIYIVYCAKKNTLFFFPVVVTTGNKILK